MYSAGSHIRAHDLQRGFTLANLLVTISILAISTAAALPQVSRLRATFNRMNAEAYLTQDLKRAQAESITQGCRGIFIIAPDGRSYSFGCDYLVYDTTVPPQPDNVTLRRKLPDNFLIQASQPIIFNSKGQTVDASGIISNTTITLVETGHGAARDFASGILLGTGVFSFS